MVIIFYKDGENLPIIPQFFSRNNPFLSKWLIFRSGYSSRTFRHKNARARYRLVPDTYVFACFCTR